jgi:hypothetical protein
MLYTCLHTVSCGAPEADETVHYSIYNSTLEGSNITYWCTDIQLNTFTSVCYKNANWVPDPISQCASLQLGMNKIIMNGIVISNIETLHVKSKRAYVGDKLKFKAKICTAEFLFCR